VTKSAKNVIYLADVRYGAQTQRLRHRQRRRWVMHTHRHTTHSIAYTVSPVCVCVGE